MFFVIPAGWCQRGKGDHSRFPATELGMKLGGLDLRSGKKSMGLPSAYLLPAGIGSWEKQQIGGRNFRKGRSVGSTGDGSQAVEASGKESMSAVDLGIRLENWIKGNRENS